MKHKYQQDKRPRVYFRLALLISLFPNQENCRALFNQIQEFYINSNSAWTHRENDQEKPAIQQMIKS